MKMTISRAEQLVKGKFRNGPAQIKPEVEKPADLKLFAERIEKKAYELYEKRGCQDGHDCEDWLEAERIVEQEMILGE